jgi:hypothetical protein
MVVGSNPYKGQINIFAFGSHKKGVLYQNEEYTTILYSCTITLASVIEETPQHDLEIVNC